MKKNVKMLEDDSTDPPVEQNDQNPTGKIAVKSRTWPRPKKSKEEFQTVSFILEPCCSCNVSTFSIIVEFLSLIGVVVAVSCVMICCVIAEMCIFMEFFLNCKII
ncbi:hypothetical protein NPIL_382311 [Nephila pilipes]|uniref:Transmembrane protein n=1 Tax=Nephila pilipes TaxID=299642 RepID=A0A8X6QA73_NEPPI|nr:hypothetical protein NPIL_382311 [Nephila pilipes]